MVRRSALASAAIDAEEKTELFPRADGDRLFRILVLGDFSGRANRGLFDPAWQGRGPLPVSASAFDEALARVEPEIEFAAGGETISVPFRELSNLGDDSARLRQPEFEALESAWRGLRFIAGRIENQPGFELHLLDVSKAELAASVVFCEDVQESAAYREIAGPDTGGASPWTVVAGLYVFDASAQDQATLARMAAVASRASTPFLAEASPRLLGTEKPGGNPRAWTPPNVAAVRRRREARWIGLALPRFLLRAGGGGPALWGNPALVCACMLAEAFASRGREKRPEAPEIEIPAARRVEESATEFALDDEAAERSLACGITPLLPGASAGCVRVPRLQSYAEPPAELAGAPE